MIAFETVWAIIVHIVQASLETTVRKTYAVISIAECVSIVFS
jgi:hypothetical protein